MFCPKCGQQQASDEVRFCSRCGFQLDVVSTLIATGGVPPSALVPSGRGESKLKAKRRRRQGAKLMFASAVSTPIAMGLSILWDTPGPFIIPFTIFLAGLAWMLYARWFGEEVSFTDHQSLPTQIAGARQDYLPPAQSPFVADVRQSHRTAEIIQPPSVAERTTRLLEVDDDKI